MVYALFEMIRATRGYISIEEYGSNRLSRKTFGKLSNCKNLSISKTRKITYIGNRLEALTKGLMNFLKRYGINTEITESYFGDIEIDPRKQVPYKRNVATITDRNLVEWNSRYSCNRSS